jgi:hypothetical protein
MSVNNVHHTPITVAGRSGAEPGAAPHKPSPARHAPGNANAPVSPLPDIKPDKQAPSREIDVGLGDIRSGNVNAGRGRVVTGIGDVMMYFTGQNRRATYDQAKPVTDKILAAYSARQPADVMEVVNGVNNYLQRIVIYDLLTAQDASQLNGALDAAKKYVTDVGPNSRTPAERLESMIKEMKAQDDRPGIVAATRRACEEAIANKR